MPCRWPPSDEMTSPWISMTRSLPLNEGISGIIAPLTRRLEDAPRQKACLLLVFCESCLRQEAETAMPNRYFVIILWHDMHVMYLLLWRSLRDWGIWLVTIWRAQKASWEFRLRNCKKLSEILRFCRYTNNVLMEMSENSDFDRCFSAVEYIDMTNNSYHPMAMI